MAIHLLPSNRPGGKQRGPNIGALESLELFHDVEMRLVPGSAGMMPLDGRREGGKPPGAIAAASPRSGLAPIPNESAAPAEPALASPGRSPVRRRSRPSISAAGVRSNSICFTTSPRFKTKSM